MSTLPEILDELRDQLDAAVYAGVGRDGTARIEFHDTTTLSLRDEHDGDGCSFGYQFHRATGGGAVRGGCSSRETLIDVIRDANAAARDRGPATVYAARAEAVAQEVDAPLATAEGYPDDFDLESIADEVLAWYAPETADGVGLADHTGYVRCADVHDFWAAVERSAH